MSGVQNISFSGPAVVFHERRLPVKAIPAGYAALIDAYSLKVPLPRTLSAQQLASIRKSVVRGSPLGNAEWQATTAKLLGLESTLRPRGRPKKKK